MTKNAEALGRMEQVNTLVVDKTGTLTEGRPAVTHITTATPTGGDRPGSDDDLLRLAAGVERASEHPLAHAIVAAAEQCGLPGPEVADFGAPAGRGVLGTLDAAAERLRGDGATVIYLGIDSTLGGLIAVAEPVKETTPPALDSCGPKGSSPPSWPCPASPSSPTR